MSFLVFAVMNDKLSTNAQTSKLLQNRSNPIKKIFNTSTITKYLLINIYGKRVNSCIYVECYQGNFVLLGLENYNLSSFRCERKGRRL